MSGEKTTSLYKVTLGFKKQTSVGMFVMRKPTNGLLGRSVEYTELERKYRKTNQQNYIVHTNPAFQL
jgi:hypothetical protein